MKNIKKPIIVFVGFIFCLSIFLILIKGIKFPAVPFMKSEKTDSLPNPKVNYEPMDGRVVLKYKDLDGFFNECCSYVVKDTKSKEDNGQVKIKGKATFPFPADFEAKMSFAAEESQIKVKISEITLGKVESPEILRSKFEELAQKTFYKNINSKYEVKDVKITSKGVEVEVKQSN